MLWLAIAYVCLASIVLWIFIRPRTGGLVKGVLIALVVWYGLSLYYAPRSFMGWPTKAGVPYNSRILAFRIQEPSRDTEGGIYLWLNTRPLERHPFLFLDPRSTFLYFGELEPRAYKFPYERRMHENIVEAQRQKRRSPGSFFVVGGKKGKGKRKGRGERDVPDDQLEFRIVNPMSLLPKEGQSQDAQEGSGMD